MDMTWVATLADKLASAPLGSRSGGYDSVSRLFSAPGVCQPCYQTGTSSASWRQHPLKRRALYRWLHSAIPLSESYIYISRPKGRASR